MSDMTLDRANVAPGLRGLRKPVGAGETLMSAFHRLGYVSHEDWAWANYKTTLATLAADIRRERALRGEEDRPVALLEIGGGRDPLFTPQEARDLGLAVTVNDIDPHELSQAPAEFGRALFDVAGDLATAGVRTNAYDLIFSRMVMEHVRDVPRAWRNCHALLAPGGIALAFFPTLYAPPFIINRLIPEALSARILRLFFPDRHEGVQPKFPALYDHCRGGDRVLGRVFDSIGYSESLVVPFWNHGYFRAIPGLRELDRAFQNLARQRNWRAFTTYVYALARK